jgi:hypothetical protein
MLARNVHNIPFYFCVLLTNGYRFVAQSIHLMNFLLNEKITTCGFRRVEFGFRNATPIYMHRIPKSEFPIPKYLGCFEKSRKGSAFFESSAIFEEKMNYLFFISTRFRIVVTSNS